MKTVLLLSCLLIFELSFSQAPIVQYQRIDSPYSQPVDIVNAGDNSNRLFIVQKDGIVRIWNGVAPSLTPFINISGIISGGGERGLLSMAFHPQYATNRYFFLYYTNTSGNLTLARYQTQAGNANLADAASAKILLTIPHPGQSNHNGGKLLFGSDGYLYLGTGDGGGGDDLPNNAQNGLSLLGKMLRIDVNDFADNTAPFYAIPPNNPYVGNATVAPEIIALGLRNPWRWSFDKTTGDMWIGDVGQSAREEVDFRAAASILQPTNYGWRCLEGSITNPNGSVACPAPANYVPPIFDYTRSAATGGFVITGGMVYRGSQYPLLQGYYVCTDYATGNIWLIYPNNPGWVSTLQTTYKVTNISGFGADEQGEMYAVKLQSDADAVNTGALYKITAINGTPLALQLLSFTGKVQGSTHELQWETVSDQLNTIYVVERKTATETGFTEVARKKSNSTQGRHSIIVNSAGNETYYYRLQIQQASGAVSYSAIIALGAVGTEKEIFKAAIRSGNLNLQLLKPANSIEIATMSGAIVFRKKLAEQNGTVVIPLEAIPHQLLLIRVIGEANSEVQKLFW